MGRPGPSVQAPQGMRAGVVLESVAHAGVAASAQSPCLPGSRQVAGTEARMQS